MSKSPKSAYEPIDKLSGVPWNFIRLVCPSHGDKRPEYLLTNSHAGPCYQCSEEGCGASFPALVHEKLLDDIMKILNEKGNMIGYSWHRQVMRHVYSFAILDYDHEAGAVIGVKRLN